MKRNTIKWRIFKYNIIVIVMLILLTTVVFNIAIRFYIENDIKNQLGTIASRAEETALHRGPDFFPYPDGKKLQSPDRQTNIVQKYSDLFRFYFMLDRSLREPLSLLNADYLLLDTNKEIITSPEEDYFKPYDKIINRMINEIDSLNGGTAEKYMNFTLEGTEYTSIIKPVSGKNSFGLGWIIIFSRLDKVNQLQFGINIILFIILILSALVIAVFSSLASKKISAPFSSLNRHIGIIAERNFGIKINMPVDDELQEFVNNINTLSEKLESYDKAQKTFLQNASHEFRTPLMSIQSYAEGIKYDVVEVNTAADIIIDETRRMTHLVEDLLYLSRLDTIEESYRFEDMYFDDLIYNCIERMKGIAIKNGINIFVDRFDEKILLSADKEKLTRAFTNVISNCIRYASAYVNIRCQIIVDINLEITIKDDGPGIDEKDLPNIFDRFYKGKKGNFGLGLAISKNVIERHNGKITAENTETGALFRIVLPIKQ